MEQNEITLNHSTNYNSIEDSLRNGHHGWRAYCHKCPYLYYLYRFPYKAPTYRHPFLYEYGWNMNDRMIQEPYYEPRNNNLRLVINSDNTNRLPSHFRKTTDLNNLKGNNSINLNGLANLNISGSSQFSENGLILVKQSLGNAMPIIIVDLREESHGFINGIAISWVDSHNKANKGLTKEEVLSDENARLQSILLNRPISIGNRTLIPKKVEDEENLVRSYGISYMRIPVTDKERPTNAMIDYFIKFVNSLLPNTWLHFHCKAGAGRTTTFMVMYDMMKNAKNVSLQDIMNRQVLLGGKDLLRDELHPMNRSKKRAELIKRFYRYCVENNDNFKTTWSQWIRQHRN
ncbi:fused DSP-PTPase phosphatase/NAD kinase-like protein [uncultured Clostridium sp.]|uniref:phosphatase domain-containing putative toxin n=1 Tax=uncultured Clostridium sp. TaxID=59620 RepID=UPI0028ED946B|nr:phosphatase [uncultured Clostridium sp.]